MKNNMLSRRNIFSKNKLFEKKNKTFQKNGKTKKFEIKIFKNRNFRKIKISERKKHQTFFFQPVFLYGTNYISKESRALLEQSGGRRLTFSVFLMRKGVMESVAGR